MSQTIRVVFPVEIRARFTIEGAEATDHIVGGLHYVGMRTRDFVDVVPNNITEHGKHALQHVGLLEFARALWIGTGNNPTTWLGNPLYGVQFYVNEDIPGVPPLTGTITAQNYATYLSKIACNNFFVMPIKREMRIAGSQLISPPNNLLANVAVASREHTIAVVGQTPQSPARYVPYIISQTPIQFSEVAAYAVPGQATAVAGLRYTNGTPRTRTVPPNTSASITHTMEFRLRGVQQNNLIINAWLPYIIFARKVTPDANDIMLAGRAASSALPPGTSQHLYLDDDPVAPLWIDHSGWKVLPLSQPIQQYGTRYIARGVTQSGWIYRDAGWPGYLFEYPVASVHFTQPPANPVDVIVDFIPQFWNDSGFIV